MCAGNFPEEIHDESAFLPRSAKSADSALEPSRNNPNTYAKMKLAILALDCDDSTQMIFGSKKQM